MGLISYEICNNLCSISVPILFFCYFSVPILSYIVFSHFLSVLSFSQLTVLFLSHTLLHFFCLFSLCRYYFYCLYSLSHPNFSVLSVSLRFPKFANLKKVHLNTFSCCVLYFFSLVLFLIFSIITLSLISLSHTLFSLYFLFFFSFCVLLTFLCISSLLSVSLSIISLSPFLFLALLFSLPPPLHFLCILSLFILSLICLYSLFSLFLFSLYSGSLSLIFFYWSLSHTGLRCGLCSSSSLVYWPSPSLCWRSVSDYLGRNIRAFLWPRETSMFSLSGSVFGSNV